MTHPRLARIAAATCILCSTIVCGCGTTAPSRFYTLHPLSGPAPPARETSGQSRYTVGVGPVEIPDFLERPILVTRTGENELEMAEYDRWAGSLKQDIARVLIQDLSGMLPPGTTVVPWKRSIPLDYRVAVEVVRLDVAPDREVLLRCQWAVYGRNPKVPLAVRTGTFIEQLAGNDYGAAVTGIGQAVAKLGGAVATDIGNAATADRLQAAPVKER